MNWVTSVLDAVNQVVWGPGMLLLLIGTGLYLTIGMRFITIRNIHKGFLNLWKGRATSGKGELSPFNALMTIPNLTAVLLLSSVVFRAVREHELHEKRVTAEQRAAKNRPACSCQSGNQASGKPCCTPDKPCCASSEASGL